MSWKTHGATPRDNTQKVANATVTKKSNMPSKSEPLIHVCLYKGSCWVGTLGTARHKASLPPPPPIGGTARHGTAQNRAAHGDSNPPPLCLLHQVATILVEAASIIQVPKFFSTSQALHVVFPKTKKQKPRPHKHNNNNNIHINTWSQRVQWLTPHGIHCHHDSKQHNRKYCILP